MAPLRHRRCLQSLVLQLVSLKVVLAKEQAIWECNTEGFAVSSAAPLVVVLPKLRDKGWTRAQKCCNARNVWRDVVSRGGCGSIGSVNGHVEGAEDDGMCREALAVCSACQFARVKGSGAPLNPHQITRIAIFDGKNVTMPVAGFGSANIGSFQLSCVASQLPGRVCALQWTEIGILFGSGFFLLVFSLSVTIIFHKRYLKKVTLRWARPLARLDVKIEPPVGLLSTPSMVVTAASPAFEHLCIQDSFGASGALRFAATASAPDIALCDVDAAATAPMPICDISPPKPPRPPAPATPLKGSAPDDARLPSPSRGPPPLLMVEGGSTQAVAMGSPIGETLGRDSFSPDLRLRRTPVGTPVGTTIDKTVGASSWSSTAGMGASEVGWPDDWVSPTKRFGGGSTVKCLGIAVNSSPTVWPPRLARVWGLRSVFIVVASLGVLLRMLHIALCSVHTLEGHEAALFATIESLFCLLPFGWCVAYSRRPRLSAGGIPDSVVNAYFILKAPRFSTFVAALALFEVYSTITSGIVVNKAPCDVPAWKTILLCAFGVPASVARCYSALIALKLQDELSKAVEQVLPEHVLTACEADLGFDFDVALGVPRLSPKAASLGEDSPGPPLALCDAVCDKPKAYLATVSEGFGLAKKPRTRGPCGSCCRRRGTKYALDASDDCSLDAKKKKGWCPSARSLLQAALVLAVLGAIISVLVVTLRATQTLEPAPPSACVTAQNATATCEQFEALGDTIWDWDYGATDLGKISSQGDCCSGCDVLDGCQAWIYEHRAKRCRWLRFLEAPCSNNPADLRCRCLTHHGTTLGFRPTSQIVWLQRGS